MSTPTLAGPTPTRNARRAGGEPLVGAYPLLIALLAVALGVSGVPAPLYGVYEREWHLAPITTTLVFAVYAFAPSDPCWSRARSPTATGASPSSSAPSSRWWSGSCCS